MIPRNDLERRIAEKIMEAGIGWNAKKIARELGLEEQDVLSIVRFMRSRDETSTD